MGHGVVGLVILAFMVIKYGLMLLPGIIVVAVAFWLFKTLATD